MSATLDAARRPRRWLVFLPLAAFALLAALLFVRLNAGDPSRLPSALIDQSAPPLTLPPASTARRGGPMLISARADACSIVNCFRLLARADAHLEDPHPTALAEDDVLKAEGVVYRRRRAEGSSWKRVPLSRRRGGSLRQGRPRP